MKIKAKIVKAFTKDPSKGNPAGVIFETDGLFDEDMIKISAQLGFSESVFVFENDGNIRLRYFTPTQEVDFCGHATMAAAHFLSSGENREFDFITNIGNVPVKVSHGLVNMQQKNPEFFTPENDRELIAGLLGISSNDLLDLPIQTVSTGASKLMVGVKNREVLFTIKPNLQGIKEYSRRTGSRGFYPFTTDTINPENDFHTRQFNPFVGIDEDPITGVAAGPLGAYSKKYNIVGKNKIVIEQGFIMNKEGEIYVEVTEEDNVFVGGYAVVSDEEEIAI